jgi:rhodanese-related sulfurtransferase
MIINFLILHWELSLAFMVVLGYWIFSEIAELKSHHGVVPLQLVQLLNRESGVIVDIRDAKLFEEGHILGALNIAEKNLFDQLNKIKKHQTKPIILVDANGMNTPKHMNKLVTHGFEQIKYLKNGMQGWLEAKLPTEKGKANAKD